MLLALEPELDVTKRVISSHHRTRLDALRGWARSSNACPEHCSTNE
jgi:hypothetical protein